MTEVADVVRQLATGRTDWQQVPLTKDVSPFIVYVGVLLYETQVTQKFPKFEAQETKS